MMPDIGIVDVLFAVMIFGGIAGLVFVVRWGQNKYGQWRREKRLLKRVYYRKGRDG